MITSLQADESRADDHQDGDERAQHGNSRFHVHVIERLRYLTLLDQLRRRFFWNVEGGIEKQNALV